MSATGRMKPGLVGDPTLDSPWVKEIHSHLLDGGVTPKKVEHLDEQGVTYRVTIAVEDPRTAPGAWAGGGMSAMFRSVATEERPDSVYAVIEVAIGYVAKKDAEALAAPLGPVAYAVPVAVSSWILRT